MLIAKRVNDRPVNVGNVGTVVKYRKPTKPSDVTPALLYTRFLESMYNVGAKANRTIVTRNSVTNASDNYFLHEMTIELTPQEKALVVELRKSYIAAKNVKKNVRYGIGNNTESLFMLTVTKKSRQEIDVVMSKNAKGNYEFMFRYQIMMKVY